MQLIENFENITITDLPQLAENIIRLFDNRNIICLQGEIGAGKTTLTKQIVKNLLAMIKPLVLLFQF